MLLQCAKLLELGLEERRKVLEQSGLCLYCLKHATELGCYGRGGFSKPKCNRSRCNGEHTVGAHRLLGEGDASVNLVTEGDPESEKDKECWVSTVRIFWRPPWPPPGGRGGLVTVGMQETSPPPQPPPRGRGGH